MFGRNQLAVGWHELGDLSSIGNDREALKAALAAAYPAAKPGSHPVNAGQLYRFATELAVGDIVVYRALETSRIHLAEVTGPYTYDTADQPEHPNRRPVQWIRDISVTAVSQGALYELGSALTFFQLKNYADEWAQILGGAEPEAPPTEDTEDSLASVSEATEQKHPRFRPQATGKGAEGTSLRSPCREPTAHDGLQNKSLTCGRGSGYRHSGPP
jgi:restriction system protein